MSVTLYIFESLASIYKVTTYARSFVSEAHVNSRIICT